MRRFKISLLFSMILLVGCTGGGGAGSNPSPTSTSANTTTATVNSGATTSGAWLSTSGNHIVKADKTPWVGRGANLHDTRSCGATTDAGEPLTDNPAGLNEVKRRIDALTGDWKVNFIRLALESRRPQDNYLTDANYRSLVKEIIDYIGTKPNVYVLVSIWLDPSIDAKGWPTDTTNQILAKLAQDFYDRSYVMFGVSNEPEENYDGALDAQVWDRMNSAVAAIRAAESGMGPNRHIIAVQGTRDWARDLSYYLTHPITAGSGANIVYETHIYNPAKDFDALFLTPAKTLPVVIGEYGPVDDAFHKANLNDVQTLMTDANAAGIPYLAWTFHQDCHPNLISDQAGRTWAQGTKVDGIGMPLIPTDFGTLVKTHLQQFTP